MRKLLTLMLLLSPVAGAQTPWWETICGQDGNPPCLDPYVLTLFHEDEPQMSDMPGTFDLRDDCVAYAMKVILFSKGYGYTGFVCQRGRRIQ